MPEYLKLLLTLLSCPDDGHSVRLASMQLCCNGCDRSFPLYGNVIELLPRNPVSLSDSINKEYRDGYLALFNQRYYNSNRGLAWGAEETAPKSWVRKRQRQVLAVRRLVTDRVEPRAILCDIAAGAGYYTFAYHKYFHLVLHCDLSVANLSYASRRARERGLANVLFLRIDYFQPPFRHSLDRLICLDTLIRGEEHDSMLLKSICRCLRPQGRAVVDFHNWWHNPLRRLGILPENFHNNRSYKRSQTDSLLREAGFTNHEFFSFVQEFEPDSIMGDLLSPAMPSTRLVYSTSAETDNFTQDKALQTRSTWTTKTPGKVSARHPIRDRGV